MLDDDPELLRPGTVGHTLYQQAMNARLRPGHFYPVDNRVRRLLDFSWGT